MMFHDVSADIAAKVSVDHFTSARHRAIYLAMLEILHAGEKIDPSTIFVKLNASGQLDRVVKGEYVIELWKAFDSGRFWHQYYRAIHNCLILRTIRFVSIDLLGDIASKAGKPEDLLADAVHRLTAISSTVVDNEPKSVGPIVLEVMDEIGKRIRHRGDPLSVMTGFTNIDEYVGGMKPGNLLILAARPGVGKSSLAANISENVARRGQPVLFISLEMSQTEIVERMLASEASIPSQQIQRGHLNDDQLAQIMSVMDNVGELPIFISDAPGQNMIAISTAARRMVTSRKARLVIVDYLQLIDGRNRGANRTEIVSAITRDLKNLAAELGVPILALSQLNRGVENRGGKPKLSDLRESGSIEQDANVVMLMHQIEKSEEVEVSIAKNRSGPTGVAKLRFDRARTRFEDGDGPQPITAMSGDDF